MFARRTHASCLGPSHAAPRAPARLRLPSCSGNPTHLLPIERSRAVASLLHPIAARAQALHPVLALAHRPIRVWGLDGRSTPVAHQTLAPDGPPSAARGLVLAHSIPVSDQARVRTLRPSRAQGLPWRHHRTRLPSRARGLDFDCPLLRRPNCARGPDRAGPLSRRRRHSGRRRQIQRQGDGGRLVSAQLQLASWKPLLQFVCPAVNKTNHDTTISSHQTKSNEQKTKSGTPFSPSSRALAAMTLR